MSSAQYTYYGESDGLSARAVVNEAIREAVSVTGEHGWEAERIDFCHEEVFNEDVFNKATGKRGKWEPEAQVILRRKAP